MFTKYIKITIYALISVCVVSTLILFCACDHPQKRKRKDYIHDRKMNIYHDNYSNQAWRDFVPEEEIEEFE